MRIYVLRENHKTVQVSDVQHQKTEEAYYLLDHIERFSKQLQDDGRWTIRAELYPRATGSSLVKFAEGLEDAVAGQAMEQLMRFTSDLGEGTAIISWNGRQFTRRVL